MKKILRTFLAILIVLPCMFITVGCFGKNDANGGARKMNNNDFENNYSNSTITSASSYCADDGSIVVPDATVYGE